MGLFLPILRNGKTETVQGVVLIDPATGEPVSGQTVTVDAGTPATASPALPAGATGLIGWLDKLRSLFPTSLGGKTATESLSVTSATDDPLNLAIGTKDDAAATTDAGSFSLLALVKRLIQGVTTLRGQIPASLGAKTGANSLSVVPAGDAVFPVGATATPSATFDRPADTAAYAIGDLVANNTVAGAVLPLEFTVARVAAGAFSIIKARLRKSGTWVTGASFKLHLFSAAPTVTYGDNGAFLPNQAVSWLGSIDFSSMQAFSDGAVGNGIPSTGSAITVKLAAGQIIYGLMESRGAGTPVSSESFTLILEALQD